MTKWDIYEPGQSDEYIAPEQWGKDHWSTLLYAESMAVNHGGSIDNRRMRTDARLHRHFVNVEAVTQEMVDGSRYPTRLANGKTLDNHDDWSCLEDAAAAGYVRLYFRENPRRQNQAFGNLVARVELTDLGFAVAHAVRKMAATGTPASKVRLPDLNTNGQPASVLRRVVRRARELLLDRSFRPR
jgi:hypothetical protein